MVFGDAKMVVEDMVKAVESVSLYSRLKRLPLAAFLFPR
jgi:hypothetical protein